MRKLKLKPFEWMDADIDALADDAVRDALARPKIAAGYALMVEVLGEEEAAQRLRAKCEGVVRALLTRYAVRDFPPGTDLRLLALGGRGATEPD